MWSCACKEASRYPPRRATGRNSRTRVTTGPSTAAQSAEGRFTHPESSRSSWELRSPALWARRLGNGAAEVPSAMPLDSGRVPWRGTRRGSDPLLAPFSSDPGRSRNPDADALRLPGGKAVSRLGRCGVTGRRSCPFSHSPRRPEAWCRRLPSSAAAKGLVESERGGTKGVMFRSSTQRQPPSNNNDQRQQQYAGGPENGSHRRTQSVQGAAGSSRSSTAGSDVLGTDALPPPPYSLTASSAAPPNAAPNRLDISALQNVLPPPSPPPSRNPFTSPSSTPSLTRPIASPVMPGPPPGPSPPPTAAVRRRSTGAGVREDQFAQLARYRVVFVCDDSPSMDPLVRDRLLLKASLECSLSLSSLAI